MSDLFVDNIKHQSSQGSGTITLGASGETIALASGAQVSGFTGQNYPAFEAYLSSAQSLSDATSTKIQFNTETFDTDNTYDNATNYRFTPTIAGKYFVYSQVRITSDANNLYSTYISFKKNGNFYIGGTPPSWNSTGSAINTVFMSIRNIIEFNGSTDYLEVFGYFDQSSAVGLNINEQATVFGGYRIGA
jgi:hypothetical protein